MQPSATSLAPFSLRAIVIVVRASSESRKTKVVPRRALAMRGVLRLPTAKRRLVTRSPLMRGAGVSAPGPPPERRSERNRRPGRAGRRA